MRFFDSLNKEPFVLDLSNSGTNLYLQIAYINLVNKYPQENEIVFIRKKHFHPINVSIFL